MSKERNVYFRRKSKLSKAKLANFSPDLKEHLADIGLPKLRSMLAADPRSPVMVIV